MEQTRRVLRFGRGAYLACWARSWAKCSACILPGLKGIDFPRLGATIGSSPEVLKVGSGLKERLKLQQAGAHKISTGGGARLDGLNRPDLPGSMQVGPLNCLSVLKSGNRGNWGLKKGFKVARSGPMGGASGSKDKWRMEEGGTRSGAEGSSDPLVDPAWICARGLLLHAREG